MTAALVVGAPFMLSTAAVAAEPKASVRYTGTGADYMNNAPHWAREATGKISFKTSADRRRIVDFRGTYSYYCGGGTSYIKAAYLNVDSKGRFAYDFSFPNRLASGKTEGRIYAAISGQFLGDGSTARVSYLADAVFTGAGAKPVHEPYSTKDPGKLGCASWVKGTVRAR
ncbi:MAG: hypothetical protein ACYDA6_03555 [Solirubrobacteraceae bacterium]